MDLFKAIFAESSTEEEPSDDSDTEATTEAPPAKPPVDEKRWKDLSVVTKTIVPLAKTPPTMASHHNDVSARIVQQHHYREGEKDIGHNKRNRRTSPMSVREQDIHRTSEDRKEPLPPAPQKELPPPPPPPPTPPAFYGPALPPPSSHDEDPVTEEAKHKDKDHHHHHHHHHRHHKDRKRHKVSPLWPP